MSLPFFGGHLFVYKSNVANGLIARNMGLVSSMNQLILSVVPVSTACPSTTSFIVVSWNPCPCGKHCRDVMSNWKSNLIRPVIRSSLLVFSRCLQYLTLLYKRGTQMAALSWTFERPGLASAVDDALSKPMAPSGSGLNPFPPPPPVKLLKTTQKLNIVELEGSKPMWLPPGLNIPTQILINESNVKRKCLGTWTATINKSGPQQMSLDVFSTHLVIRRKTETGYLANLPSQNG